MLSLNIDCSNQFIHKADSEQFPHVSNIKEFIKEFFLFLKERKKYWLLPVLIISLILGGLLVLTQGTALAPFIYTIF